MNTYRCANCSFCQVQRIILHQDENGELRVVDMATEREVKKMLESSNLSHTVDDHTTMVVHVCIIMLYTHVLTI